MMGRGNTGPVYPWFGKDIRDGIPLAIENYALLHRLWREESVDWEGQYRTPLQGFTSTPRPLDSFTRSLFFQARRCFRKKSIDSASARSASGLL